MKCYKAPIDAPTFDYNVSYEIHLAKEEKYINQLKKYLIDDGGFTGKYTGEIIRFPVADGNACYMVADGHKTINLIHLSSGDAYQITAPHMRGLRKSDIITMIENGREVDKLFKRN